MRKKLVFVIFLLLFILPGIKAQEPYFRLKDISNQWQEYDDLKGSSLTVIDFWATWCQPCIMSIPHLNEMASDYAEKGVNFIGVSVDGPRNQSKLAPFTRSLGISYPILRDINRELMSDLSVTAVPTLLIYNAEGKLIHTHEGFRPGDELSIREILNSFLN